MGELYVRLNERVCARARACLNQPLPCTSALVSKPRGDYTRRRSTRTVQRWTDNEFTLYVSKSEVCGGQAGLALLNERKSWYLRRR